MAKIFKQQPQTSDAFKHVIPPEIAAISTVITEQTLQGKGSMAMKCM